mgnify:CR=1 FL=1
MPAVPHSVSWVAMRTYATILVLLLTVPAYAVDTLKVTSPDHSCLLNLSEVEPPIPDIGIDFLTRD